MLILPEKNTNVTKKKMLISPEKNAAKWLKFVQKKNTNLTKKK